MTLTENDAWLRTTPISHRGLHDVQAGRPENSLAAFAASCLKGYPIELDVQLTKDGQVVVFHDENFLRLTGVEATCETLTAGEIAELRIVGTTERVPTFMEALSLIDGRVPVLVDVKATGRDGRLERKVKEHVDGYGGVVALQSFDPLSVLRLQGGPHPVGQVSGLLRSTSLVRRFVGRSLLLTPVNRASFITYELAGLPALPVAWLRRRGLPVLAWTVHDEAEERRARQFADNVIFSGYEPATQSG